jgi:hypothetical protein
MSPRESHEKTNDPMPLRIYPKPEFNTVYFDLLRNTVKNPRYVLTTHGTPSTQEYTYREMLTANKYLNIILNNIYEKCRNDISKLKEQCAVRDSITGFEVSNGDLLSFDTDLPNMKELYKALAPNDKTPPNLMGIKNLGTLINRTLQYELAQQKVPDSPQNSLAM